MVVFFPQRGMARAKQSQMDASTTISCCYIQKETSQLHAVTMPYVTFGGPRDLKVREI